MQCVIISAFDRSIILETILNPTTTSFCKFSNSAILIIKESKELNKESRI